MLGPLSPAPKGRGGPEGLLLGSPQRGSGLGKTEPWEAISQPGASHKTSGRPPGHSTRVRRSRPGGGLEGPLLVLGKPVANI